jgi:ribosomal protein L37E
LISHQKAKHFKCERCGRRLNTAGGRSLSSAPFYLPCCFP